jgi:hypothetical protein
MLDAFKEHLTSEIKATINFTNTDLVAKPGRKTSQLEC